MCKKSGCLISLVLVLALAANASASIAFDAVSSGYDGGGDTTLSWSHTIGSGSNRVLIVCPLGEDSQENDLAISSVKYNNVNMTAVSGGSRYRDPVKGDMYYMLEEDLPSAGTYTVQITYNGTVSDLAPAVRFHWRTWPSRPPRPLPPTLRTTRPSRRISPHRPTMPGLLTWSASKKRRPSALPPAV